MLKAVTFYAMLSLKGWNDFDYQHQQGVDTNSFALGVGEKNKDLSFYQEGMVKNGKEM